MRELNPQSIAPPFARYAHGVFSKLGNLLLRYRLSESFSIEISAGTTQSMDILYTIEKE